jgi:predicted transcriptional regulator
MTSVISKVKVFDTITDRKTLSILKMIASSNSKSDLVITELRLTRKQFYSRMSLLLKEGLVKRHQGRYFLTSFGKVSQFALMKLEQTIDEAVKGYWTLKVIDLMLESSITREECKRIISTLTNNEEIKNALTMMEVKASSSLSNVHARPRVGNRNHNEDLIATEPVIISAVKATDT